MRYKEDHKEQTHKRIVEAASREFRARGFDGIGIAPLMSSLKLTHGGFYAHFDDKEDLVVQAMSMALQESRGRLVQALDAGGIEGLLDYYTSEGHRDNPAYGCPLPALSAEEGRRPIHSRESFTREYNTLVETVAQYVSGPTLEERVGKVQVMFASLTGAVSLARAISDGPLSNQILQATREHLRAFLKPLD